MKHLKLKALEKSYEEGLLNEDEYEKKKKEIEDMPEDKVEKLEEEEVKDVKLKSDKILIVIIIIIVALFVAIFGLRYLTQEEPKTIDDLHSLN